MRRLQYAPPAILLGGEGPRRVTLTRQDWRPDDGGGWGRNGTWSARFADDDPWRVRVLFPEGAAPERVVLGINSGVWTHVTHEARPEPGSRECVLEGVRHWLHGRPASIRVTLEGAGDGREGPHQVIFER